MSNRWIKNLQFNMKAIGLPKLINKDSLDDRFVIDNFNIVGNTRSYFYQDPRIWSLPAKNYFVRICLAYYVSKKFDCDIYDLMNDPTLLPYDDMYSPIYKSDKETYDRIIGGIDIEKSYGYKKSIEVFGYLYEDIVKSKSLTLGYNLTGQSFFDTICFKKNYIKEFFFSLTHRMPLQPLTPKDIAHQLTNVNTYGIPANLLLNTDHSQGNWIDLLKMAMDTMPIRAVTVLTIEAAREIKECFPDLILHISTHGAPHIDPMELDSDLIEAVNICEPYFYEERELMKVCRDRGIKLKYIINRGCVVGKSEKMSAISGREVLCYQNHPCMELLPEYPWLDLLRTNLYKESLQHFKPDFIKISTREQTNEEIKTLLDYWTSPLPTQRLCNIPINDGNYDIFLAWAKQRFYCNGKCLECMKCKTFYEGLIGNGHIIP